METYTKFAPFPLEIIVGDNMTGYTIAPILYAEILKLLLFSFFLNALPE